ncbi:MULTISPECIES: hypothetical protein [Pseudomonas]|uniref:DUF4760 domain-containing protein n=1 Tax=Pseudomonas putida TaxID=303 RepID=A0A7D5ZVC1_PSEPU|nr:hypothetical protein [Pseudomonas putida]PTV64413.1 hypothetical protein DBL03_05540 [Pseudomonas putida]QLJ12456.1 hypothetical protein H0H12_18545 [Pseudomonas putida]
MSCEGVLFWIEHHPGLASWVQAVGSIGAIVGAFAISSGQNRRQGRLAKRTAIDRFDAYCAVIKNAVESAESVSGLARDKAAYFEFRSVWEKYLGESFKTSLEAAKAILVHDLADYKLVVYYSGLMGSIYKMHYEVEKYMAATPSPDATSKAYDDLKQLSTLINFDWIQFQERAELKRIRMKR